MYLHLYAFFLLMCADPSFGSIISVFEGQIPGRTTYAGFEEAKE